MLENYGKTRKTPLTVFEAGFPCNVLNLWTLTRAARSAKADVLLVYTGRKAYSAISLRP